MARYNVNIPMIQGEGNASYCYAICNYAIPIIDAYNPTMIFVACGFDALAGDPYASMGLTPPWFVRPFGRSFVPLADLSPLPPPHTNTHRDNTVCMASVLASFLSVV